MLTLQQKVHIRWERAKRWEFWPAWLFYIPIVIWIVLLGLRHRHFTAFTATNPGMDEGGVVGERKAQMLLPLRLALPDATPELILVPATDPLTQRRTQTLDFIRDSYPVVLKPDIGQRGRGVLIAKTQAQVEHYLAHADFDVIVQRFIPGLEYGLFVYRDTGSDEIQMFSITAKKLLSVIGDGRSRLDQLILAHPRARLSAEFLFAQHHNNLNQIVADGQAVPLVEVGSHCRGAVFLNANTLASEALRLRMQAIANAMPGFHFGRLDIIVPDADALQAGRDLQVLEINGVTSEAAHVYHPGASLLAGYRSFFKQWQLAFAIGSKNLRHGATGVKPLRLLRLFLTDLARFEQAEDAATQSRTL